MKTMKRFLVNLLNFISEKLSDALPYIIFFGGGYSAYVLKSDGHTVLAIIQGIVLFFYAIERYDNTK